MMRHPLYWHRVESWIPELGYILHEDAVRQTILEQDLSTHAVCSEVIREVPSAIRRKKVLCFLGFKKGQISHVARSEIRYKARSGNDRLDIWKLEPLPNPISARRLASAIKGPRSAGAKNTVQKGGHLSPKAFELTLAALKSLDTDAFAVADGLYQRTRPVSPALNEEGRTNWVLQRDTVVTALDLAKIPREQLAVTSQAGLDIQPGVVSIFDNIGEVRGLEDILVMHDLNGAAGWDPIRTHKFPAKTFRETRSRGESRKQGQFHQDANLFLVLFG
jgi:hypothetical protein